MRKFSRKIPRRGSFDGNIETLEAKVFQRKLERTKNPIVIDVSTPEEFEKGSIPKAINVSYQSDNFWDHIKAYINQDEIFVCSYTGHKSVRACMLMRNGGFEKNKIYNLEGGYRSWEKGRV